MVSKATSGTAIVVAPSFYCVSLAYYAALETFAEPESFVEELGARRVQCADDADAVAMPGPDIDRVVVALTADADSPLSSVVTRLEASGFSPLVDRRVGATWVGVLKRRSRLRSASKSGME